jgi:predicted acylesterase/phospholipase RssA
MAVAAALAEELQAPHGGEDRRSSQPVVVSVVGLGVGAPVAAVGSGITAGLARHLRVLASGGIDPDGLARAEAVHDRVVLVADDPSGADDPDGWYARCLRQADQVVAVADAGASPVPLPFGDEPHAQPDVVLVGQRPERATVVGWADATDAYRVTVSDAGDVELAAGLRPLVARLAGRSIGLALAGGGARAFAHVGVILELEEAGLHIDRLTGCSIGAIVAAAYASGRTGEQLEAACYDEFVRRQPFGDYTLPTKSLARGRRTLDGLVRAFGAETTIEEIPRQFTCVSTDLVSRSRQEHRRGRLVDAVLASVRLPVLFPPIPDGQRLLVDGGVLDNLPVDLLTARSEGPVVAVNIAMGGSARPRPSVVSAAGAPAPPRPVRIPALGETLLRTMMIGSGGAVSMARGRGAVVVTPPTLGVGLLEFHQFDRMVTAGRQAGRAVLDALADDTGNAGVGPVGDPRSPTQVELPDVRETSAASP